MNSRGQKDYYDGPGHNQGMDGCNFNLERGMMCGRDGPPPPFYGPGPFQGGPPGGMMPLDGSMPMMNMMGMPPFGHGPPPMSMMGPMGPMGPPMGMGPGGPPMGMGPGGPPMGMGPGGPMNMGHGGQMNMGPGPPMGMGPVGPSMGMGPGGPPMGMGPVGHMNMGLGGPINMGSAPPNMGAMGPPSMVPGPVMPPHPVGPVKKPDIAAEQNANKDNFVPEKVDILPSVSSNESNQVNSSIESRDEPPKSPGDENSSANPMSSPTAPPGLQVSPQKQSSDTSATAAERSSDQEERYSPSRLDTDEEAESTVVKPKVLGKDLAKKRLLAFSFAKMATSTPMTALKKLKKVVREKPSQPVKGTSAPNQLQATVKAIEEEKKRMMYNLPVFFDPENLKIPDLAAHVLEKNVPTGRGESKEESKKKSRKSRSRSRSGSRSRRKESKARSRSKSKDRTRRHSGSVHRSVSQNKKRERAKDNSNTKKRDGGDSTFEISEIPNNWRDMKASGITVDTEFRRLKIRLEEKQRKNNRIGAGEGIEEIKPIFNYRSAPRRLMMVFQAKPASPADHGFKSYAEKNIRFTKSKPMITWAQSPAFEHEHYFMPRSFLLANTDKRNATLIRYISDARHIQYPDKDEEHSNERHWYPRNYLVSTLQDSNDAEEDSNYKNRSVKKSDDNKTVEERERKLSLVHYESGEESPPISTENKNDSLHTNQVKSKWDSDNEGSIPERESQVMDVQIPYQEENVEMVEEDEPLQEKPIEPNSPVMEKEEEPQELVSEYEQFLKLVESDTQLPLMETNTKGENKTILEENVSPSIEPQEVVKNDWDRDSSSQEDVGSKSMPLELNISTIRDSIVLEQTKISSKKDKKTKKSKKVSAKIKKKKKNESSEESDSESSSTDSSENKKVTKKNKKKKRKKKSLKSSSSSESSESGNEAVKKSKKTDKIKSKKGTKLFSQKAMLKELNAQKQEIVRKIAELDALTDKKSKKLVKKELKKLEKKLLKTKKLEGLKVGKKGSKSKSPKNKKKKESSSSESSSSVETRKKQKKKKKKKVRGKESSSSACSEDEVTKKQMKEKANKSIKKKVDRKRKKVEYADDGLEIKKRKREEALEKAMLADYEGSGWEDEGEVSKNWEVKIRPANKGILFDGSDMNKGWENSNSDGSEWEVNKRVVADQIINVNEVLPLEVSGLVDNEDLRVFKSVAVVKPSIAPVPVIVEETGELYSPTAIDSEASETYSESQKSFTPAVPDTLEDSLISGPKGSPLSFSNGSDNINASAKEIISFDEFSPQATQRISRQSNVTMGSFHGIVSYPADADDESLGSLSLSQTIGNSTNNTKHDPSHINISSEKEALDDVYDPLEMESDASAEEDLVSDLSSVPLPPINGLEDIPLPCQPAISDILLPGEVPLLVKPVAAVSPAKSVRRWDKTCTPNEKPLTTDNDKPSAPPSPIKVEVKCEEIPLAIPPLPPIKIANIEPSPRTPPPMLIPFKAQTTPVAHARTFSVKVQQKLKSTAASVFQEDSDEETFRSPLSSEGRPDEFETKTESKEEVDPGESCLINAPKTEDANNQMEGEKEETKQVEVKEEIKNKKEEDFKEEEPRKREDDRRNEKDRRDDRDRDRGKRLERDRRNDRVRERRRSRSPARRDVKRHSKSPDSRRRRSPSPRRRRSPSPRRRRRPLSPRRRRSRSISPRSGKRLRRRSRSRSPLPARRSRSRSPVRRRGDTPPQRRSQSPPQPSIAPRPRTPDVNPIPVIGQPPMPMQQHLMPCDLIQFEKPADAPHRLSLDQRIELELGVKLCETPPPEQPPPMYPPYGAPPPGPPHPMFASSMHPPPIQWGPPPGPMQGPPVPMQGPPGPMSGPPVPMQGPTVPMQGPPVSMQGPPVPMQGPPPQMAPHFPPQGGVLQVGNIMEVVPTIHRPLPPPPPPPPPQHQQQIVQVGNVLQVVPSSRATAVVAPTPVAPEPSAITSSAPPPLPLVVADPLQNPMIKALQAEREKRRKEKEARRLEREARRRIRQAKRDAKLMSVAEKLKKSVQNEGLMLGQDLEDEELLMEAMAPPSPLGPVEVVVECLPPAGKSILVAPGVTPKDPGTKKNVRFADGLLPGEASASEGAEEHVSPVLKPKLPKEKRFKKKVKRKVKVQIIRQVVESDDEDDDLSPPDPPPGDPPPVFYANLPFGGAVQYPIYQTSVTTTTVTTVQFP